MAWIGLGTVLLFRFLAIDQRIRLQRRWSHQILAILAVRIEAQEPAGPPGRLIVANHVSWLDIFAINAVCPAAFVSKAELRGWPFVGWLAARYNTIFLRRGSRGHARIVNAQINAWLNSAQDVAIFPEGTTTDGTQLLGFHAALLQSAVETGRPALPLALAYHEADGRLSPAPAYAGDTTLWQCFAAILARRELIVRIVATPLLATAGQTRRALSLAAHAAIAATLADTLVTRPGFQPANISPEKSPDLQAG